MYAYQVKEVIFHRNRCATYRQDQHGRRTVNSGKNRTNYYQESQLNLYRDHAVEKRSQ